uniref:Ig-like domain-containing protein n=1 Tax=Periophthalmus magnuspinnatus TaxID=409849 RepID=A0A3B4AIX1_9GOBI
MTNTFLFFVFHLYLLSQVQLQGHISRRFKMKLPGVCWSVKLKATLNLSLNVSVFVLDVAVAEGRDAILPCSLESRENIERFSWSKDHKEVFFYDTGRVKLNKQQRLTHFEHELKSGNASIKIRNTQKSDSGRYSCKVSDIQPSRVMLYVVDAGTGTPAILWILLGVGLTILVAGIIKAFFHCRQKCSSMFSF